MTTLISTTELGDYLGRDLSSVTTAELCCEMATEVCRTYSEQTLFTATETISLDGTGTDALLLPQLPVNAVGTVIVNGGTAGTADYALDTEQGILVAVSGTATWFGWGPYGTWGYWGYPYSGAGAALWPGPIWPKGRQNIQITYDHGYGTAGSSVPADVRMVAMSVASRLLVQGVAAQETVGDTSVRYAANSTDLTKGEENILRKYKRSR